MGNVGTGLSSDAMKLTILNDVHGGANRAAGTTSATQMALRDYIVDEFRRLMPEEGDLMILGDLFDTGGVPIADIWKFYTVLHLWLSARPGRKLYNVAGNHDLNKTSNVVSSFQFLGRLLSLNFGNQYHHIEVPTTTPWGYVIPHMVNQDLFNIALEQAAEMEYDSVFLHCNYDNNFAAQADQSLNLSPEQAEALQCNRIIIAHEHHQRSIGRVLVPGCQIATSVADWQQNHDRFYTTLSRGTDGPTVVEKHISQHKSRDYVEMQYTSLSVTDHKFVKVTGNVSPTEINSAVAALNRLRRNHPAFVIANGIKTIHSDNAEVIAESLENVQGFDIWHALEGIMLLAEMTTLHEVNALA